MGEQHLFSIYIFKTLIQNILNITNSNSKYVNFYKLSEQFGSLFQIQNKNFIYKILNEKIIYTYIILLADFNFFIIFFKFSWDYPLNGKKPQKNRFF